jgi:hypothetical protein
MARIYQTAKRVLIWPGSIPLNVANKLVIDIAFSRSNVRPIIRRLFVKITKMCTLCPELTLVWDAGDAAV